MKKVISLVAFLLVLTGCSSSSKSTTCKIENQGIGMNVTVEEGDKDKVGTAIIVMTMEYEAVGITKETAEKNIETIKGLLDAEGITTEYKAEDVVTIATTTIDFSKASKEDFDALQLGLDYSMFKDVSYDEAVKALEDNTFACE